MNQQSRTLLIDAQLFQSYTFHRGMGKYSLALLEALNDKLPMYTNKVLLFNNISGYLSDEEMATIKRATPGFSYEFLGFKHSDDIGNFKEVQDHNKGIVDEYIHERLPNELIDFLILSLFQETELPVFPTNCSKKYVLVYDLIPLQFFKPYLEVENVAKNYLYRFESLFEADHFFTISLSVASDVALQLGVPKHRITPIYGAPVKRKHLKKTAVTSLLGKRFILLPSGDDYRKNNPIAVKAFEEVNNLYNREMTLVITSSFTDETKARLNQLSEHVMFTGNVTESQLAWLYESAELIFFPSQAEGLGLPILEAIEFGKKVVCSSILAFKEIDKRSLYFCDPYIQDNIVDSLRLALESKELPRSAYKGILERYNWDASATLASGVFADSTPEPRVTKQRIAVFSPKPDGFSGVGKVVQEQHYCLARYADVTYFFENGVSARAKSTEIRKNYLRYAAKTGTPWSFDQKQFDSFERVIYHIGNGEYHTATLVKSLAFPCHIVLHDTRIKGLFNVVRSVGAITTERYEAEQLLNDKLSPQNGEFLASLVSRQKRVIVHSDYSRIAVNEAMVSLRPDTPEIVQINLAIPEPYSVDYSVNETEVKVALAGLMTESKGIDLVNAITSLQLGKTALRVKIFGFSMLEPDVLHTLNMNDRVEVIQSPTDTRYLYEIAESDIMLNFRSPYHGETSYSTIEALRFGKSIIVNNTGWFSELPDNLVYKVNTITDVEDTIKDIVRNLMSHRAVMKQRVDYIISEHNVQKYVRELIR